MSDDPEARLCAAAVDGQVKVFVLDLTTFDQKVVAWLPLCHAIGLKNELVGAIEFLVNGQRVGD